jgi:hypothetical protein
LDGQRFSRCDGRVRGAGRRAAILPVRLGVPELGQRRNLRPAAGFDQALVWVVVALLAWGW